MCNVEPDTASLSNDWANIVEKHAAIVLVARTEQQQSLRDETIHWWKEYACAVLDDRSRAAVEIAFPSDTAALWMVDRPVALLRRRVDAFGDGTIQPRSWELLHIEAYAWDAAQCGDSAWERATSTHPLHAYYLTVHNQLRHLRDEQAQLKAQNQQIQTAIRRLALPVTQRFSSPELEAALKAKRLWSKAVRGELREAEITGVRESLRERMSQELVQINTRLGVIQKQVSQLKQGIEAPPLLPDLPSIPAYLQLEETLHVSFVEVL